MENPKQTVSVLFFFFSLVSVLCFFNNFDLSTIIFVLSDIYELINRRNMILLCHFILIFIVKDSGLLSHRRNECIVVVENGASLLEKDSEFEVKEVRLERKEEPREVYIQSSFDIVIMEKTKEVSEPIGEGELDEELMEIMESSGEEIEDEDLSKEEIERNGEEEWEVMERNGEEEEVLENGCVGVMEQTREAELENESVDELNRKIEEFIKKIRMQMQQPNLV